MTNKIFKSVLTAAVAVLLASLIIIIGALYPYFCSVQESQLKDELHLAAEAVQQLGEAYLKNLTSDRYRLTWICSDGTVIFDSHADAAAMENHADREEIREALTSGTGSSTRHSSTLTQETIYEAARLQDGSVLRISVSRATALVLVLGMLQPIAIVLVIAIALSAWLAHRMAKRVVEPLNKLDLDNPMEQSVYEELSPLLHRIHAQRLEINSQMRTLKQKQDEFDQITCSMKEGLVLLDHNGRILSINPAARALLDADAACVGKDFLTVDRQQTMRLALEEAGIKGHADFRARKHGRAYQFDLSRIDSDGTRQGMVILVFDITEQEDAEQHRREFTANVSHELKTPLQSIIGSAELMENGIVKQDDIPVFVSRIRKEATRLVTLINDIIRLSQLDEGGDLPHEDVSLLALSEEVCETLTDAANAKRVTMEVTGDDGVVYGVHRLLYEVIHNLCDNAFRYNNPGGTVCVSVAEEQGAVRLCVADSGIGIAPEHQSKVFERFYRVDKSHSRASGGTGLGLSIVKHAVQYHHGTLQIHSEPGKGTEITVTFPKNCPSPL